MSADTHNTGHPPVHDDVAFEKRDVRHTSVLAFLFYLAITLVLSFGLCWGVLRFTEARIVRSDPPPPPVRANIPVPKAPEPRLQAQGLRDFHDSDPQQDFREKLARDRAALDTPAWVDEKGGIAQIPVEDAMKILLEKGLPEVAPPPPANKQVKK